MDSKHTFKVKFGEIFNILFDYNIGGGYGGASGGGGYNNFSVPPPNFQQQMQPKSGGYNDQSSYNKGGIYYLRLY